ncbi:MAG: hypothetical protein JWN75_122 [Candidatus Saccharibacteria bacterium]|nr:hypothetical protein [Candidatus Saccharibacteria bacterium]
MHEYGESDYLRYTSSMNLLSHVFYFFAPYTDRNERAVGMFFAKLSEHSNQSKTRSRLGDLLQRDIAVINLWSEYRYKGYKYLRKSNRRKMYTNLQLIADDFERFRTENTISSDAVVSHIHKLTPHATIDDERAVLLQAIMNYLDPDRGLYEYRESSSFGRLLRDPSSEKLVGDCNQIVTLYIYLYSQYFDVTDMQIRLLPGHVALHYGGVDIEATNGTFANYHRTKGASLLPIEEIVSVNLLDTTDSYLSTHEIAAEDFLQASRFAFILSHERNIVTHNLDAAYSSLISSLMKRDNYRSALKIARASRDIELIGLVSHNGAVHYMNKNDFATARRFAKNAPKRKDLVRDSYRAEGAHYFDTHKYHNAIKAFKQYGDQALVRQCYEALFYVEQDKLGSNMTTESIKNYASTIKRMRTYAKKSGNKKLIEHAHNLNKHL